ncbi:T-cell surface antigen CD2-like isoform X3 [Brachyhypopomus gauderio]|uniref:T-cell surface antigen CD2-like isoform X3 n=1 Tax=Brachyhypopomus gauderio TaxID=698409 RepID=UPI004043177F
MQMNLGVLVMLSGAVVGVMSVGPAVCRVNQNVTCYGALGQELHLELDDGDDIILYKGNIRVLKYKRKRPSQNHTRWQFIADNRTIIIPSTEREDSGTYRLDTFDVNGTDKGKYDLHLNIEAVVSSVKVSYSCLSSKKTVSCSSEGDQLHFNWTLSGNRITHQLDDGNKTLLLEKEQVGNVTCHVQNHISHGQSSVELHQCPDLTLITLSTISVLLVILSIIVCLMYKKKQDYRKKTSSSQNGEELVYAKVTHISNNRTSSKSRTTPASEENVEYAEVIGRDRRRIVDEVQYGEVAFNPRAAHLRTQASPQEECVYSHVHHGQ